MPHICHITSAHRRYDTRIVLKQCVSLVKAGYEVTLLVNDEKADEDFQGVKIISTGTSPKGIRVRLTTLRELYQTALKKDCDLYHLHDPELLVIAYLLKRRGKKAIFDFHEYYPKQIYSKEWLPKGLRHVISNMYSFFENFITKKIDAAVTVTPDLLEHHAKYAKSYLIANYPYVKETKRVPHQDFTLCFAGGTDPQWNHHLIIQALEGLDQIKYSIASPTESDYLKSLRSLPAWESSVKYMGHLSSDEVNALYETSDVGMTLLANNTQVGRRGTLGNTKIFEFMAARLPIICSDHEVWQEIIERYKCGIAVDSEDVEAIRKAILYLYNNPSEAVEMGERGRQAIEEVYNWENQKKILLQMYDEVLNDE